MGTNYYVQGPSPCGSCGRGHDNLHIGKSSAGWPFHFQALEANQGPSGEDSFPHPELKTKEAWEAYLRSPGLIIVDEYDAVIDVSWLLEFVEEKQSLVNAEHVVVAAAEARAHGYGFVDAQGYRFSTGYFS